MTSTNEAFTKVAGSTSKVGELVAEIAAASNEQAQGIEQVNTAVSEMDKVTQSNAANAEEYAGASEEMRSQAEQMMAFVADLAALVGRGGNTPKKVPAAPVKAQKKSNHQAFALAPPLKKSPNKSTSVRRSKKMDQEQMIPLDGDFTDF